MMNRIDLNLLAAFEALHVERSVTRAAVRHGVTQPAMSNALRRLRELFEDPLFVRTPDGMMPTRKAAELAPTISAALQSLRGAVGSGPFDPSRSAARFTLGTLDYLEVLYLGRLVGRLAEEAPGVTTNIMRLDTMFELPNRRFESGTLDCALGLFQQPLAPQTGLRGEVLDRDDWVCVSRRGHPALKKRLDLKTYTRLLHIGVSYPDARPLGIIDRQLAERGLARSCAVITPHFLAAALHAVSSDCVTNLPRRLVEDLARRYPLQYTELPWQMPPLYITLVWTDRTDQEPAHRWFRDLVKLCVRGGAADFPMRRSSRPSRSSA